MLGKRVDRRRVSAVSEHSLETGEQGTTHPKDGTTVISIVRLWYSRAAVSTNSCDVAVIGGGPAGASTAIYLRQRGYDTVVLEKLRFPRFHIGESLLPANLELFDELGIHEEVKTRGYPTKFGAEFVSQCGDHVGKFHFRDALVSSGATAYQVLRSDFDHIVLSRARALGADVREEATVTNLETSDDGVEITVAPKAGDAYSLRASVVVDASGQDTFLSSRFETKQLDQAHRRFAIFSHFEGVDRQPGEDSGNIRLIPFGDGHWFWVIPLRNDVTSIGAVVTKEVLREHRDDVEAYFRAAIEATPALTRTMSSAHQVEPVRAIADFSYESSQYAGDRYLIVGDAAAFVDPIFSAGVLIAMSSAKDAAKAIDAAFRADDFSARVLQKYEREHRRKVRTMIRLIRAYYRPAFLEMFMNPVDVLGLKSAVSTILAGGDERGFRLRWRLELFFLIGWLRGYLRSNRTMSTICSHGCSVHPAGAQP